MVSFKQTLVLALAAVASAAPRPALRAAMMGKRGMAYNNATLTQYFAGYWQVSWAYNWGVTQDKLPAGVRYMPTLWGADDDHTRYWPQQISKALANGARAIFSFNEPDLPGQKNTMSPSVAAANYRKYIQPYAAQANLGAPSITNGGGALGLNWLTQFLSACSDCTIDFVNIHWYAALGLSNFNASANFINQVQSAYNISGGKPVIITEFGPSNTVAPAVISDFLKIVMPWMDRTPYVLGYAYFMTKQGILINGTSLSSYGQTFASYNA